jgi:hypothetical protein
MVSRVGSTLDLGAHGRRPDTQIVLTLPSGRGTDSRTVQSATASVADRATVPSATRGVACGRYAYRGRADADAVLAGPACGTVIATFESAATTISNGSTVVVAARSLAGQWCARWRRAHTEVVDASPSSGTVIATFQGIATAIPDRPAIVVFCCRLASYQCAEGRLSLANIVRSTFPAGLRARVRTVELPATAVANRSTIVSAWRTTRSEASGPSVGTRPAGSSLPATVRDVSAGCCPASEWRTDATIRGAGLNQNHKRNLGNQLPRLGRPNYRWAVS